MIYCQQSSAILRMTSQWACIFYMIDFITESKYNTTTKTTYGDEMWRRNSNFITKWVFMARKSFSSAYGIFARELDFVTKWVSFSEEIRTFVAKRYSMSTKVSFLVKKLRFGKVWTPFWGIRFGVATWVLLDCPQGTELEWLVPHL